MEAIVGPIVGAAVGAIVGIFGYRHLMAHRAAIRAQNARDEAEGILEKAKSRAEELVRSVESKAKEEQARKNRELDRKLSRRRHDADRRERKLQQREEALDRKHDQVDQEQAELQKAHERNQRLNEQLTQDREAFEAERGQLVRRAEEIAGLTADEAKRQLLEMLEREVRQESAATVRRVEAETRELANKKARQIITLAIQKSATEQVCESTVSVVNLPNDDMKGRIIGREGRNIRALEAATGCNIIVDDTPEAVVLSCFDPMRREIARLALEQLINDGRIHPARIEEVVAKVEKDIDEQIREAGEKAVIDLGIPSVHPELIKTLGRLMFRTSYGQNVLQHSIETARLCAFMSAELGADAEVAKRAGLLHDIGKALSHEVEGTHALIGAELCRKCNELPGVVHAVAAHHNEEEPRTIIAVLVQAADAISSARPGVRREAFDQYIKRLQRLEEIADAFPGVAKSYALQAGRELRIMVEPTEVNDNEAALLAREVSQRIEKELEYPGQIKVIVCREVRVAEYAK